MNSNNHLSSTTPRANRLHSLSDALVVVLDGLVSEHSEDVDGAEGGSEHGDDTHEDSVLFAVVVDRVVGGERDQGAESDREGVEHLGGGVHPYGRVDQLFHLWAQAGAMQIIVCD